MSDFRKIGGGPRRRGELCDAEQAVKHSTIYTPAGPMDASPGSWIVVYGEPGKDGKRSGPWWVWFDAPFREAFVPA